MNEGLVLTTQGYHKTKAFIATQGPLPDTQDDFWKLIWQQGSASVVMLTKEKEGGKVTKLPLISCAHG